MTVQLVSPGAKREGGDTEGLLEIRWAQVVTQGFVQVQIDARLRQEVGRVRELHRRTSDKGRWRTCTYCRRTVAWWGDRAQARRRSYRSWCKREYMTFWQHELFMKMFLEVLYFSLTCSPGPCMVCESNRGRSLLGNGEQVCIWPIGQTWAGVQHLYT